jgi:hypothetical protein
MQLERRMLYVPILHIDANLINARQRLAAVNQLEQWYKDEVILINMSSTAHQEAQAGGSYERTRKANEQIFTVTAPVAESDPLFKQVGQALFPGGVADANQRNDVRIVCEAAKYHAILVTSDGASKTQPGGILGNRHKLNGIVQVMSPEEAVAFVREKIFKRDEFNQRFVKEFGGELPSWTGQDNGDA